MTDDRPANFRELVGAMRAAQKRYWRERTQKNLQAALKLELRVDTWLSRHRDEQAAQLEAFREAGDDDDGRANRA